LLGKNPDRLAYRFYRLQLAVIRGDQETVRSDLDWMAKQTSESDAFDGQANVAAFYGQWRKSLDLSRRSIDLLVGHDRKETAAQTEAVNGFFSSQLGLCDQAKQAIARSLVLARGRLSLGAAARAL